MSISILLSVECILIIFRLDILLQTFILVQLHMVFRHSESAFNCQIPRHVPYSLSISTTTQHVPVVLSLALSAAPLFLLLISCSSRVSSRFRSSFVGSRSCCSFVGSRFFCSFTRCYQLHSILLLRNMISYWILFSREPEKKKKNWHFEMYNTYIMNVWYYTGRHWGRHTGQCDQGMNAVYWHVPPWPDHTAPRSYDDIWSVCCHSVYTFPILLMYLPCT